MREKPIHKETVTVVRGILGSHVVIWLFFVFSPEIMTSLFVKLLGSFGTDATHPLYLPFMNVTVTAQQLLFMVLSIMLIGAILAAIDIEKAYKANPATPRAGES